jgi:hypothetical protein
LRGRRGHHLLHHPELREAHSRRPSTPHLGTHSAKQPSARELRRVSPPDAVARWLPVIRARGGGGRIRIYDLLGRHRRWAVSHHDQRPAIRRCRRCGRVAGLVGGLLLDPMVSMVLLAVLRAEQITTRYQVSTGVWPRVSKWALLAATYVMNTWTSWAASSASGVVLHSVSPLVVVLAAEAVTDLQYALTECVHRVHAAATARAAESRPRPAESTLAVVGGPPRPLAWRSNTVTALFEALNSR